MTTWEGHRPPVSAARVCVLVAAIAVTATACGTTKDGREARTGARPSARPAPAGAVLDLDFEQSYVAPGAIVATAENTAKVGISAAIVTSDGGRITRAEGFDSSSALRFPAYEPGATPAAVLLVSEQGGADQLSPGDRAFAFGADFNLDEESSGSPTDNGDNLVQRGLSADPVQYKIQIDHGVPSCRVAGATGEAVLTATDPVRRNAWYRVNCRREGATLTLVVKRLGHSGAGARQVVTASVTTGTIQMAPGVPLSVGGKTDADGQITTSATDQFNGLVDNVHYEYLD